MPRVGDGAGAGIAGNFETLDQRLHADDVAGLKLEARAGDEAARRDPLHDGVDGGQNDERLGRVGRALGKRGKGRDTSGDGFGVRRNPVVRNAVPGGEAQDFDIRREEAERFFQGGEPGGIARDMQDRGALSVRDLATGKLAEDERIEPLGHASGDRARALEQTLDGQVRKLRRR